jgi:uncharacterized protein YndB with AHSA1/START domain
MATAEVPTVESRGELVIVRILDAPPERVFRAWTEAEQMMCWMGPRNFTTPFCSIDLRVGGKLRNCMRSPEGKEYWGVGVFREIVPPKRLVYSDSFSDESGNVVDPGQYGMAEWPVEALVEVNFAGYGTGTELTLIHHVPTLLAERYGCRQGWSETLDRLVEFLSEERDVFLGGEAAQRDVVPVMEAGVGV